MESETAPANNLVQKLNFSASPLKIFLIVLAAALVAGAGTGYILASGSSKGSTAGLPLSTTAPKSAQQDASTFKDFAEGVIQPKPSPTDGQDQYSEGAYLLIRQGAAPVALTSSVVDLSQYIGKKVKVYGETQQAIQAGWLMDVGRVDVEQ